MRFIKTCQWLQAIWNGLRSYERGCWSTEHILGTSITCKYCNKNYTIRLKPLPKEPSAMYLEMTLKKERNTPCCLSRILQTEETNFVFQKCEKMLALLDEHDEEMYTSWAQDLDLHCEAHLTQPILRHDERGLLEVHFNEKVPHIIHLYNDHLNKWPLWRTSWYRYKTLNPSTPTPIQGGNGA